MENLVVVPSGQAGSPIPLDPLRPHALSRRAPARTPRERMFALEQLEVSLDTDLEALWTFMRPKGRPAFNLSMLRDFERWQDGIIDMCDRDASPPRYLVLGSNFPGVFGFGGDLDLFARCIRAQDRESLVRYGKTCVGILHRNMLGLERQLVTIGLAQGEALGGGFEALLSFNVLVAERGSRFGLPETNFGLFPGMGAHCFLSRRLGAAKAERMILSGRLYSAEELHDLGLVHVLADPGEGKAAVASYIQQHRNRHRGHCGIYRASRVVNPLPLAELEEVVDLWAEAALELSARDLKLMERLVRAQAKLAAND